MTDEESYEFYKKHKEKGSWGFYNCEISAICLESYFDAKQIPKENFKCSENCPFCYEKAFEPMISTLENGGWCTLSNSYIVRGCECTILQDVKNHIRYENEKINATKNEGLL